MNLYICIQHNHHIDMKAFIRVLAAVLCLVIAGGCATLRPVSVDQTSSMSNYQYIYITPTGGVNSTSGTVWGGGNIGVYGASETRSANPADLISGYMLKKGFTRLPELVPELKDKTLIVNYGESGSRPVFLGTATEITIQFLSASTLKPVCICSGEGFGDTEADDIRQAITRCLDSVFERSSMFDKAMSE